jgi:hypothetical protein
MAARVAYRSTNTNDPVLSRIQDAIESAVRDLSTYKQDIPEQVGLVSDTYRANVGEIVLTNSAVVSVAISLPTPTSGNYGQQVTVVRTSASNAVNVSSPSSKVQGVDVSALPASIGAWAFVSTKAGWFRAS